MLPSVQPLLSLFLCDTSLIYSITTFMIISQFLTLTMGPHHNVNGPCSCGKCGGQLQVKLAKGGNFPGHDYIHVCIHFFVVQMGFNLWNVIMNTQIWMVGQHIMQSSGSAAILHSVLSNSWMPSQFASSEKHQVELQSFPILPLSDLDME